MFVFERIFETVLQTVISPADSKTSKKYLFNFRKTNLQVQFLPLLNTS